MLRKETEVHTETSFDMRKLDEKLTEMSRQSIKRWYMTNSLLGKRYLDVSFGASDVGSESFNNALERCQKYCENCGTCSAEGYGIYLFGDCGVGKTHLMACMVNDLLDREKSVTITNFLEISKELRKRFDTKESESDFINRLTSVEFLFIDDIGTERVQVNGEDTFIQERIYDIINTRYLKKKPTVFSSNLSFADLVEQKGLWTKTVDRIVEMSSAVLKIEGKSHRLTSRAKGLPF